VSDPELNEISAPAQGEVKSASQDDGAPKQRKRDKATFMAGRCSTSRWA